MSAAGRRGLYPEVEPFSAGWLPTGGLHEIYYEECGAQNGKPVVVLHGGPGGAINTTMRRFFDAAHKQLESKLAKPLGSRFSAVVVFRQPGT